MRTSPLTVTVRADVTSSAEGVTVLTILWTVVGGTVEVGVLVSVSTTVTGSGVLMGVEREDGGCYRY